MPKLKLLAVSLSHQCIKKPRCSFCYRKKEKRSSTTEDGSWCALSNAIDDIAKKFKIKTVCFEYSGYNLDEIIMSSFYSLEKVEKTMTTMPQAVTKTFCGAIYRHSIKALSISYDTEKVKCPTDWIKKAKIAKSKKLKVGCNFLIEKIPTRIPIKVLKATDQLNLLALKPMGKIKEKAIKVMRAEIMFYQNFTKVTTDN